MYAKLDDSRHNSYSEIDKNAKWSQMFLDGQTDGQMENQIPVSHLLD